MPVAGSSSKAGATPPAGQQDGVGAEVHVVSRADGVGGPDAAIQGFLKATGLASLDQAKIQRDPKKGDFYIALIEKPGRATLDVLADILPVIIRTFPWPKSMRWGARSATHSALQWVRPLHAIVATFGIDTEEPEVVKFSVDGIEAAEALVGVDDRLLPGEAGAGIGPVGGRGRGEEGEGQDEGEHEHPETVAHVRHSAAAPSRCPDPRRFRGPAGRSRRKFPVTCRSGATPFVEWVKGAR